MAKHSRSRGGGNPFGCCCGCLFNCICSCLFQILCTLLVLAGVVALILWLIFRPNAVKFYVDDAALSQFDFSAANNTLLYNLALNMSIRNPNKRIGIYYDVIEARALYAGQRFAAVNLDPFFQPTKNTSDLRAVIKGQNLVPLGDGEKSDYSAQKNNGAYRIDLKLFLQIRLKFWLIKSKKIKPTIDCALDNVPLRSNSGNFERTKCHLDW
ncbi:NDR1/HIN1-like protein 3 [Ipomoea triloba]|uniref:NDR1/HIN1-like protein 3 n=1 Tax=Ipomoea triloba TaxID=35885 RepID=UPI00125E2E6A|nr:NDR1/HIN1-like protein 3 [Ipomoea triloba]